MSDNALAALPSVLFAGLGAPEEIVVAHFGDAASARVLADAGARVYAIEPDPLVRATAADHDGIAWIDGTQAGSVRRVPR